MTDISNVFLLHWCPDDANDPTYNWHRLPRIEAQLQQKNIEVFRPLIPTPRNKSYEYFKQAFAKYDIDINEKSVLIGHSCGGTFLVRRLSENDKKIAKLLLVAPRKIWEEKKEGEDLYDFTINPNLNTRVGEITYFTSDDEDLIGKKSLTIFHETLQGNIIELPHHGHYTLWDMGTDAFPELLEEILK